MELKFEFVKQPGCEARIDPNKISDTEYEIGCRVLAASIERILADPAKRAQYEVWKEEKERGGNQ